MHIKADQLTDDVLDGFGQVLVGVEPSPSYDMTRNVIRLLTFLLVTQILNRGSVQIQMVKYSDRVTL